MKASQVTARENFQVGKGEGVIMQNLGVLVHNTGQQVQRSWDRGSSECFRNW